MTTHDRARAMAEGWHCRYCNWLGPDTHPAMKCNWDVEDAAAEIAVLLDLLVEARGRLTRYSSLAGSEVDVPLIEKIDTLLGDKK